MRRHIRQPTAKGDWTRCTGLAVVIERNAKHPACRRPFRRDGKASKGYLRTDQVIMGTAGSPTRLIGKTIWPHGDGASIVLLQREGMQGFRLVDTINQS